MNILFWDGVYSKAYDQDTLLTKPMGGTEATVLRVISELSKYHDVSLYTSRAPKSPLVNRPDIVITLRDAGHYIENKKKWPSAKHYLWLHDIVSGEYRDHMLHHMRDQPGHFIVVSDFHKSQVIDSMYPEMLKGNIRVTRVYNPLAEYCVKTPVEVDPFKLVFFSSPHKGLDYVKELFKMIRRINPNFKLYIANPGYYPSQNTGFTDGIITLGSLAHSQVIDHVRTALCTFYPQTTFPETFGLVMAESEAVGTPVIAHRIGAAAEVLQHPHELMDCRDYKAVVDRVIKWSQGERPLVKANKWFTMEQVIKDWKKLL